MVCGNCWLLVTWRLLMFWQSSHVRESHWDASGGPRGVSSICLGHKLGRDSYHPLLIPYPRVPLRHAAPPSLSSSLTDWCVLSRRVITTDLLICKWWLWGVKSVCVRVWGGFLYTVDFMLLSAFTSLFCSFFFCAINYPTFDLFVLICFQDPKDEMCPCNVCVMLFVFVVYWHAVSYLN